MIFKVSTYSIYLSTKDVRYLLSKKNVNLKVTFKTI